MKYLKFFEKRVWKVMIRFIIYSIITITVILALTLFDYKFLGTVPEETKLVALCVICLAISLPAAIFSEHWKYHEAKEKSF